MQNRSVYPQNDSPNDSTYFTDYTGIYVQQQHAYNKQVWIIINLLSMKIVIDCLHYHVFKWLLKLHKAFLSG